VPPRPGMVHVPSISSINAPSVITPSINAPVLVRAELLQQITMYGDKRLRKVRRQNRQSRSERGLFAVWSGYDRDKAPRGRRAMN